MVQRLALVRLQDFSRVGLAAEQQAGFLERLANAGNAEAQGLLAEASATVGALAHNIAGVARVGAAAGEHQRALGEVDLVVAFHHEDFHAL